MDAKHWRTIALVLGGIILLAGGIFLGRNFSISSTPATAPTVVVDPNSDALGNNSVPSPTPEPTITPSPTPAGAIVRIEAAIIYIMGGAQPIAREKIYLLDKDLAEILYDAGLEPSGDLSIISNLGFAVKYPSQRPGFYTTAMKSIRKHIRYSTMTDFQGKTRFPNVAPDSYYLFAISNTRGGFAIWNLKTKIGTENKTIFLDNNNAEVSF